MVSTHGSLWGRFTAEYILQALARVMVHDEQRSTNASVRQFWEALMEDQALYGMVRHMRGARLLVSSGPSFPIK